MSDPSCPPLSRTPAVTLEGLPDSQWHQCPGTIHKCLPAAPSSSAPVARHVAPCVGSPGPGAALFPVLLNSHCGRPDSAGTAAVQSGTDRETELAGACWERQKLRGDQGPPADLSRRGRKLCGSSPFPRVLHPELSAAQQWVGPRARPASGDTQPHSGLNPALFLKPRPMLWLWACPLWGVPHAVCATPVVPVCLSVGCCCGRIARLDQDALTWLVFQSHQDPSPGHGAPTLPARAPWTPAQALRPGRVCSVLFKSKSPTRKLSPNPSVCRPPPCSLMGGQGPRPAPWLWPASVSLGLLGPPGSLWAAQVGWLDSDLWEGHHVAPLGR